MVRFNIKTMEIKDLKLNISKIIHEAPDVKTFEFETTLNYEAGQFVMMGLENNPKNQNSYSFSSSPTEDTSKFTIKINPQGGKLSPKLDKLKEGDQVQLKGPYGRFVYEDHPSKDIVFIAAGTGVAPLRSMIKYVIDKKLEKNLSLLFSVRTPEHILYKNELDSWEKEGKLKTHLTITRPEESDEQWNEDIGRIDKEFLEKYLKNKEALIYICGPPKMVDNTVSLLQKIGVKRENLKYEKWS